MVKKKRKHTKRKAIKLADPIVGPTNSLPLQQLIPSPVTNDPVNQFLQQSQSNGDAQLNPSPLNNLLHSSAISSQGTEVYAGYTHEEYLDSLLGYRRAKEFDKMRRGDTQVKMLLNATKNPIKQSTWEIEAASDEPEDQMIADLIRHILFDDYQIYTPRGQKKAGWSIFLNNALSMVDFGHAVIEPTFELKSHMKYGMYHGIKALDSVSQKTIHRWNLAPDTGELLSVTQIALGDLHRYVDIPAEFLMHFSVEQEGANYEGVSFLRPCYGNWIRKNLYLKLQAIGIERFSIPTPIAKIPDGFQGTDQYAYLIDILENYTSGESSYITMPKSVDLTIQPNPYDPSKVDSVIDSEDRRMTKSFLANFLELGLTGSGSFAMSEDLSDFYLSSLEHIAKEICATVNGALIPLLCNMNFGSLPKLPILKYSGLSDKAGKELSEVLHFLSAAQVIVPDDVLEDNIRKRYTLPKKSDLGKRTVAPTTGGGGMGGGGGGGGGGSSSLSERIRRKTGYGQ